ncbi:MAG: diguanylate cyclase [Proteobacteria bacterium]|nr:diguanylate cyclase [Pseudomonadota bacterium]
MVLPNTNEEQAVFPLDRLREKLGNKEVILRDKKISVSVSIGIASVSDSEDDEAEAIHRADQVMYAAKRTGRNRAVCCELELPIKCYSAIRFCELKERRIPLLITGTLPMLRKFCRFL